MIVDDSMLSMAAAARRTRTPRRTLARMVDAGKVPGAYRDEVGTWHVPIDGLVAAGLTLYASESEPEAVPAVDDGLLAEAVARAETAESDLAAAETRADLAESRLDGLAARLAEVETDLGTRVVELEAELVDLRQRLAVAEAIAAERAERITDLRVGLTIAAQVRELTVDAEEGRHWWQRRRRTESAGT